MDYVAFSVPSAQNSQVVSVTTTSAQSTAFTVPEVMVSVTSLCFVVRGANPTAVANTSMALQPGIPYRLGVQHGDKLAFIAAVSASAYITPSS